MQYIFNNQKIERVKTRKKQERIIKDVRLLPDFTRLNLISLDLTKKNVRLFCQTYIFASIYIMHIIRFGMTNKLKYFLFFLHTKNQDVPLRQGTSWLSIDKYLKSDNTIE